MIKKKGKKKCRLKHTKIHCRPIITASVIYIYIYLIDGSI